MTFLLQKLANQHHK